MTEHVTNPAGTTAGKTAQQVLDGADLSGRTCVITGASSGLGRESARVLAGAGARLILAARNRQALEQTREEIVAEAPGADVEVVELDLAALRSVRGAAETIAQRAPVLDVLMNNAGVMFTPFGRTEDGFEMQFGTNHLGHFELTRRLLPQLLAAEGARVVNLSSDGHFICDVDLSDPNWERRDYDKFAAYGASKTANVQHVVELDRRYRDRGLSAFAVHPGVVATALARHMNGSDFSGMREITPEHTPAGGGNREVLMNIVTPEQGAATQVWAATSAELDCRGGLYLADCAVRSDAAPYALDPDRAGRLWELSEALCDQATA